MGKSALIERLRSDSNPLASYDPTILDSFRLQHGKVLFDISDTSGDDAYAKERLNVLFHPDISPSVLSPFFFSFFKKITLKIFLSSEFFFSFCPLFFFFLKTYQVCFYSDQEEPRVRLGL